MTETACIVSIFCGQCCGVHVVPIHIGSCKLLLCVLHQVWSQHINQMRHAFTYETPGLVSVFLSTLALQRDMEYTAVKRRLCGIYWVFFGGSWVVCAHSFCTTCCTQVFHASTEDSASACHQMS